MNRILALETATSSCSAALRIDGQLAERAEVGSNVHSQVLLSMVSSLLGEAGLKAHDLDAVAVGQGPGSFTGLRIGVGVGQGIAYGANCPMIGISSLDALALQAATDGTVLAGIDARMGEIYWCEYKKAGAMVERVGELRVSPPSEISCHANPVLVGNAWPEYWQDLALELRSRAEQQANSNYPSAAALLELAEVKFTNKDLISAIEFAPIYVRDNVAKKSVAKNKGR